MYSGHLNIQLVRVFEWSKVVESLNGLLLGSWLEYQTLSKLMVLIFVMLPIQIPTVIDTKIYVLENLYISHKKVNWEMFCKFLGVTLVGE